MKQTNSLAQNLSQTQLQTLSPQQLLVVKLLELPAVEMEERVKTELQDNPALDVEANDGEFESEAGGDGQGNEAETDQDIDAADMSLADYRNEDETPDYVFQVNAEHSKKRPEDIPFSEATSFYENLEAQLCELDIDELTKRVALYIIGSLDDDGMLRKDLGVVLDELEIFAGVQANMDVAGNALTTVQSLEPAGIGARSLQECLLLQVSRKKSSPLRAIAHRILTQCYTDFAKKRWEKIPAALGIDEQTCAGAIDEIKRLNPRPGMALSESIDRTNQTITPDFIVESSGGRLIAGLNNDNQPRLRINKDFADMLASLSNGGRSTLTRDERDALAFAKQKVDAARGFIDAVNQRRNTLLSAMQAIVDLQPLFFTTGDEASLRPMILKDVADKTGLDISTVSRVGSSKWVQTDFGVFPLKFFFNDGYVTKDGEELSVREIKSILRECVEHEDKANPLTDERLAAILKEKGYPIARRTVAKYRVQLGIPTSKLRK